VDLPCVDVGYGRGVNIAFGVWDALGDALVRPGRVVRPGSSKPRYGYSKPPPSPSGRQRAAPSPGQQPPARKTREDRHGTTSRPGANQPACQGQRAPEPYAMMAHPRPADPAQQENIADLRPQAAARENR
jgi:hypothetical protein